MLVIQRVHFPLKTISLRTPAGPPLCGQSPSQKDVPLDYDHASNSNVHLLWSLPVVSGKAKLANLFMCDLSHSLFKTNYF